MTNEEILALALSNQGSLGMTPEEQRRRQALIEAVMQHTPELAADIAKGPYRMNTTNAAPAQTVEDWRRAPNMSAPRTANTSLSDNVRTMAAAGELPRNPGFPTLMGMAAQGGPFPGVMGNPPPSTTGPAVPGQAPVQAQPWTQSQERAQTMPSQYSLNGPAGQLLGQQPNIVINVGQGQPSMPPQWRGGIPPWGAPTPTVPYNQSQGYWDRLFQEQAQGIPPYTPPPQFGYLSR